MLREPLLTATVVVAMTTAAGAAHAQIVNVQPLVKSSEADTFEGEVGANLDFRTGNFDFLMGKLTLLLRYQTGRHRLVWSSSGELGYKGGFEEANRFIMRGFTHLRHQVRLIDWLTWETYAQVAGDDILRIGLRLLVGTGPRFDIVQEEEGTLAAGLSYMFERIHERYTRTTVDEDTGETSSEQVELAQNNHRLSAYLTGSLHLTPYLTLIHTTYFQPRADDPSDIRIFSQTQLGVKAVERLSIKIALEVAYDSAPPPGIVNTDIGTSVGLSYGF